MQTFKHLHVKSKFSVWVQICVQEYHHSKR